MVWDKKEKKVLWISAIAWTTMAVILMYLRFANWSPKWTFYIGIIPVGMALFTWAKLFKLVKR